MDSQAVGEGTAGVVMAMRGFLGADTRIGLARLCAVLCCLGSALAPASAPHAQSQIRPGDRPAPSSKSGPAAAPSSPVKVLPRPALVEVPLLTMTGVRPEPLVNTSPLTMTGVGGPR